MPHGHLRKEGWSLVACNPSVLLGVQNWFIFSEQHILWKLRGWWDTLGKYRPAFRVMQVEVTSLGTNNNLSKATSFRVCTNCIRACHEPLNWNGTCISYPKMTPIRVESRRQHATSHVVRNSAQSSWPAARGAATRACSWAQFLIPQKTYHHK